MTAPAIAAVPVPPVVTATAVPVRAVPEAIAKMAMEYDDDRNCNEVEGFIAMIICFWLWLVLVLVLSSHQRWHDLLENFFWYKDSTWVLRVTI